MVVRNRKDHTVVKEMSAEEQGLLTAWIDRLSARFALADVEVPVAELLALSGAVSAGVARPAVPVTAYVAGYMAAVRAQGSMTSDATRTVQDITAEVPAPTTDR